MTTDYRSWGRICNSNPIWEHIRNYGARTKMHSLRGRGVRPLLWIKMHFFSLSEFGIFWVQKYLYINRKRKLASRERGKMSRIFNEKAKFRGGNFFANFTILQKFRELIEINEILFRYEATIDNIYFIYGNNKKSFSWNSYSLQPPRSLCQ